MNDRERVAGTKINFVNRQMHKYVNNEDQLE